METQCFQNPSTLGTLKAYARVLWSYVRHAGVESVWCVKVLLLTLFLIYVGLPLFVRANQWILPKVVFSNLVSWPPFMNLSRPEDFGLNNTRSFHLTVEDEVTIGAWHILPSSMEKKGDILSWEDFEDELDNGNMIFLYLHGNSGTRGSHHRVQLYKVLAELDFHVVTIDYRGFGDSLGNPTENGVVSDAYFTYKWLKERVGESKVFIWGHSLGTGISTKLAKKLCEEGDHPAGIVLESPFNNIQDAAFHHPFARPFRFLPWFKMVFVDGIGEHGIHFSSDENILAVTPHILILHAEDDPVVPFVLGKKLFHKAKDSRSLKTGDVEFIAFEEHLGYGHKMIYKDPELPEIVRKFVAKSV